AATIAFNGAAAWPDPLGVGMHAVIPVLFVVAVEAARHAIGRIADITADKHMEGVRLTRWLLSPVPTFLLWRRMKLWELRSYDQVIKLEQERLVYQARLRSRFGRAWRRKAPVESLMPLRLARYGVPLADTAPMGLAAAGIEPALLPPAPQPASAAHRELEPSAPAGTAEAPKEHARPAAPAGPAPGQPRPAQERAAQQVPGQQAPGPQPQGPQQGPDRQDRQQGPDQEASAADGSSPWFAPPHEVVYEGGYDPTYDPSYVPEDEYEAWYAEQARRQRAMAFAQQGQGPQAQGPQAQQEPGRQEQGQQAQAPGQSQERRLPEQAAPQPLPQQGPAVQEGLDFPIPAGPNRTRPLGDGGAVATAAEAPAQAHAEVLVEEAPVPDASEQPGFPDERTREEAYYTVFRQSINGQGLPTPRELGDNIEAAYGESLDTATLKRYMTRFQNRFNAELEEDHIA
ncbi:DUF2637 domain-containing protein, partial [Streptomyces minutiscleroticus]